MGVAREFQYGTFVQVETGALTTDLGLVGSLTAYVGTA